MNKFVLVLISLILTVLLSITGILFYAFSEKGNTTLKNYIQSDLEEKIGLPVAVSHFKLSAGKSTLSFNINKQINIEIATKFDLLAQRFNGIYRVKAKDFKYQDKVLRQLNVKGTFKGKMSNVVVHGEGTALDAALAYRFSMFEKKPRNIEVIMKGISVDELLVLGGQPPLVKGKIDVNIHMPEIGNEFANGDGHIVLHEALFDSGMVKKMYDLIIPKKSSVTAKIDVKLKGDLLFMTAKAESNLFLLDLHDVKIGLKENNGSAHYAMDVKEMGILTQNKLAGALKVEGTARMKVEGKKKVYFIEGTTHSLGGTLTFDIAEHSKIHFQNVDLNKVQYLTKQAPLAVGFLSGNANVDKNLQNGKYNFQIEKGQFIAKNIEKKFGYKIPDSNQFSLVSTGKIVKNVLTAEGTLKSTISDVKLMHATYDIDKKKLNTNYDVFFPNIGLLIPDNQAVKRGYMSLKGKLSFDKTLKVTGDAKGLGEKLAFEYDGKKVILDAENLFIEKLLSLANLPRYVKGKLSSTVNISDVERKNGSFSLRGENLVTQPNVMERLMGKKLAMQLNVTSKGNLKAGVARLNSSIKSSMGNLNLIDTVYDTTSGSLKSKYLLNIVELSKTYALTGKKLYGAMELSGNVSKDKILTLTGSTTSLGGKISYTLIGDVLKSQITKVPVENILALFGHAKLIQGDAYGAVNYNLKKKTGVVDIDIKSFQIKSSSTTQTVKMFIGKDPARIIYNSTKLHATIKGDITQYTLIAKGSRSRIEVTKGILNKTNDTHRAKFKFVYEKYEVTGTIGGTIDKPSILVDPSSIMQNKTGEKIQKKLDKALGGEMGKAVGGFLKGLKF